MKNNKKILVVLAGPTASGKTALAIELAKHFQTEIISADSRQVYKEMKIGTARPEDEEIQGIIHHCLGHVSIHSSYNAGIFEHESLSALEKIFHKNDVAIVCGGTGLYLNALLFGFDELPERNEIIRGELEQAYRKEGIIYLQEELKKLDPAYFSYADIYNPQRLIRAIEVCRSSGKTHQQLLSGNKKEREFRTLFFVLNPERELLYSRINNRVDQMIRSGMEEEASSLYPFRELNALQTVGYKEWFDYFDDIISREEAIDQIKQHTRNYAKRQMTWFRKQRDIIWLRDAQQRLEIISRIESEQRDIS